MRDIWKIYDEVAFDFLFIGNLFSLAFRFVEAVSLRRFFDACTLKSFPQIGSLPVLSMRMRSLVIECGTLSCAVLLILRSPHGKRARFSRLGYSVIRLAS